MSKGPDRPCSAPTVLRVSGSAKEALDDRGATRSLRDHPALGPNFRGRSGGDLILSPCIGLARLNSSTG